MFGFTPVIVILFLLIGSVIAVIVILNNSNKKSNNKPLTHANRRGTVGQYDDISKLADLKEKNLITQEEFEQQKKKILSHDPAESQINEKQPNSFTFKAVVFFVLGLIVPLWPISLPLFWYLAWKSYKTGE